MHTNPADLIRIFLIIIPGFYATGALLVVLRLYFIYYRAYLRKPRSNVGSTGYAFILLALSQLVFVATLTYGVATALGSSFNPRTILYGMGIYLNIIGVRFLVYAERKRVYDPIMDEWHSPDRYIKKSKKLDDSKDS